MRGDCTLTKEPAATAAVTAEEVDPLAGRRAKALYDYTADDDDELSLEVRFHRQHGMILT